jgi:sulfite reductase alpha subunit-like flavoprotein
MVPPKKKKKNFPNSSMENSIKSKGIPKQLKTSIEVLYLENEVKMEESPMNLVNYKFLNENVMEISLKTDLKFNFGDSLKIYHENKDEKTKDLMDFIGLKDQEILIKTRNFLGKPMDDDKHNPNPSTTDGNDENDPNGINKSNYKKLVKCIKSSIKRELKKKSFLFPKKQILKSLSEFCNETNKKKLVFLSSIKGKNQFQELKEKMDLIDILCMFDCKPPLEFLLEHLEPIKPRYYSICDIKDDEITFCFNIIGECTNWMKDCVTGGIGLKIELNVPPLPFYLPTNEKILMIANGTGISPLVGLLNECKIQRKECILIYGHRNKQDALYMERLQQFIDDKIIVEFIECYSQTDSEYKYVQHALSRFGSELFSFGIMVCGSGAMGKDLNIELQKIHSELTGSSTLESIEFWMNQRKNGYFKQEIW